MVTKFSELSGQDQYQAISEWKRLWKEQFLSGSKRLESSDWIYLDLLCYVWRFTRLNPDRLKPEAAALVEGLVLTDPCIELFRIDRPGYVRYNGSTFYYRDNQGHVPWPDFLAWQFVLSPWIGNGDVRNILYRLNYRPPLREDLYTYIPPQTKPYIGQDEVLYLCTLSTEDKQTYLGEALADFRLLPRP